MLNVISSTRGSTMPEYGKNCSNNVSLILHSSTACSIHVCAFARCLILSCDLVPLQVCLVLTLGMAFQRFNLAVPKIGRAKLGFFSLWGCHIAFVNNLCIIWGIHFLHYVHGGEEYVCGEEWMALYNVV